MYRDFGVGQMGDMGAHTMDLVWNVIDAGGPTAIEVDQEVSDKYNPDICPVSLKVDLRHPANKWRGPIKNVWYQGGLKPESPRNFIDISAHRATARSLKARRARSSPTSPAASCCRTTTMATSLTYKRRG